MNRYVIIFFLCLFFVGCDTTRIYEDYVNLPEAFWHVDSVKTFTFQIDDSLGSYDLKATFRNASSYPFYNLYYQYALTDSLDSVIVQELKEVEFFDPKTGRPNGSGLGDLFDHSILLEEDFNFPANGEFSIKLRQFMRMDTLPFILSVGARVELSEE
ncbi:MAG: gliding motility lipoprotein GldH [Bacteroidota bacterium]